MRNKKITAREMYYMLKNQFLNVEFICGKWFLNGKEYSYRGKTGICEQLSAYTDWFWEDKNKKEFFSYMTLDQADMYEPWPEMEIVKQAKEKIKEGYEPKTLAYPLNEKELKILHYLLDGDPKDTYGIFFHGVGGSGKSSVCNVYKEIFGMNDVSYCQFDQLSNKFARATVAGKRLVYDDDVSPNWNSSWAGTFKKMVTGAFDQFEEKFQSAYNAQYRCKMLFCCNVIPKFDVDDSGLLRRIIYYSKDQKISNPNGTLANRKYTADELLDFTVAALRTDITNFYQTFEKETKEIIMYSNNVAKYGMVGSYDTYKVQCQSAGVYPYAQEKWEKLKELFEEWQDNGEKDKQELKFFEF